MPPPLDKNLFTLTIDESKEETGATDLLDSNGEPVYRRRWGDSKEGSYAVNIFGQYVGIFYLECTHVALQIPYQTRY